MAVVVPGRGRLAEVPDIPGPVLRVPVDGAFHQRVVAVVLLQQPLQVLDFPGDDRAMGSGQYGLPVAAPGTKSPASNSQSNLPASACPAAAINDQAAIAIT